jgi:hypothetical protein
MRRKNNPPTNQPGKGPHTLVEPRLVAAVGLVALGGGLGVALMLAHTLVLLGLVISLASAAGVIWIYFAHLLEIYKALSKKTIYRGPSIKEIAVAGAKRLPSRTTGRFAASIPAVVPVTTAARLE